MGTLTIQNGALVTNTNRVDIAFFTVVSTTVIGLTQISGMVNTSMLTVDGDIFVHAAGELDITAGAQVTSTTGHIDPAPQPTGALAGALKVDGTGTSWIVTNKLVCKERQPFPMAGCFECDIVMDNGLTPVG